MDGAGRPDADDDDDSEEGGEASAQQLRRVFVFGTRKNIELLYESPVWFIDGTFKTSLSIFAQIVTVIGLLRRAGSTEYTVVVPLVYALLSGKNKSLYTEVLEVVRNAVRQYRINVCVPTKIMTEFELEITNAAKTVFPGAPVSGCFFHLSQSVYRRIQKAGLQYNDSDDR